MGVPLFWRTHQRFERNSWMTAQLEDRDIEFSVVSGSNEEMLFGCLDSLHKTLESSPYSWSVTVTCNESGTGLPGRVRARYPDASVIQNEVPLGFAANHNRVLRSSRARYVWLLNADLLILPETIERVTEYMDKPASARVGIVSPKLLNADGSVQPSTYSFPSMPQILIAHSGIRSRRTSGSVLGSPAPYVLPTESLQGSDSNRHAGEVDTLRGVCVAVRMKAARQAGEMAEKATVTGEETRWHRRFKEQGWKVIYYEDASVIYYGSRAARAGSRNLYPENLRAALYFFKTGRLSAVYPVFCAALLGVFGFRAAYSWATRDKSGISVAKRNAAVAWSGLLRR